MMFYNVATHGVHFVAWTTCPGCNKCITQINIFRIFLGTDGGLDFGTIKVMDEVKQTCTLKNKGKYDIAFK